LEMVCSWYRNGIVTMECEYQTVTVPKLSNVTILMTLSDP